MVARLVCTHEKSSLSYRARKRECFRLQRERKKARKEGIVAQPQLVLASNVMLQIAAPPADFESWCTFLIAFALCCSKQTCSATTICSLCIIINVLIVCFIRSHLFTLFGIWIYENLPKCLLHFYHYIKNED